MKKFGVFVGVLVVLLALGACETLDSVVGGANTVGAIAGKASGGGGGATAMGGIDIRSGEMVCSYDERDTVFDSTFRVGTVMTAATPATKNQAEVLFANGEKRWSSWVLETHKASKEELKIGEQILYHNYYSYESIDQDEYRQGYFRWGTITNTDELFKGIVEVNGQDMQVNWCRLPDQPLM
jgi:hypothetical protein